MIATEFIKKLELEYPNNALLLKDMDNLERERYLAKLELIEHIKIILDIKDDK